MGRPRARPRARVGRMGRTVRPGGCRSVGPALTSGNGDGGADHVLRWPTYVPNLLVRARATGLHPGRPTRPNGFA
jgi:hypothetical protein